MTTPRSTALKLRSTIVEPHRLSREDVLGVLGSDQQVGLTVAEAQQRVKECGWNEIATAPPIPLWRKFAAQFRELVIWILIVAALLFGVLGDWPDALAILTIVVLNAFLGFLQQERAERSLNALRKLSAPQAKSIRGGLLQVVPTRELVPGDVIELEAGDHIPANARILESYELKAQEASLTGESVAASKDHRALLAGDAAIGDRVNMVHFGTIVAAGKARAVVVRTGMEIELGQIAGMLQSYDREPTPLQRRLRQLGRLSFGTATATVASIG